MIFDIIQGGNEKLCKKEVFLMEKDITIIGASVVDILAGPVNEKLFQTGSMPMQMTRMSFGGDALNEAVVLSRMGKNIDFISKVGNDEAGLRILDYVKANGIQIDKIKLEEQLVTGINIVLIDDKGERHFLTNPQGSLRKLSLEDIMPYVDEMTDIVSFASIFVSPVLDIAAMEELFRKIKEKPGRILAADMTKAKNGETLDDLKKILPYIDYIFPNSDEITLLTGETDPLKNAELLVDAGVSCAVVKCGANGCLIHTKQETYEVTAYSNVKVLDTTGAGDCFAAGFLYALSERKSLPECGRFACATASCTIECVGATDGIKSVDEPLRRFLEM